MIPNIEEAVKILMKNKYIIETDDRAEYGTHETVNAIKTLIFFAQSVLDAEWPDKITLCQHQKINPTQLCQSCREVNEALDLCLAAHVKAMMEKEIEINHRWEYALAYLTDEDKATPDGVKAWVMGKIEERAK